MRRGGSGGERGGGGVAVCVLVNEKSCMAGKAGSGLP